MGIPDYEKKIKEHIFIEERAIETLNEDADNIRQLMGKGNRRNFSNIVNLALAHYLSLPESEREKILYGETDVPSEGRTKIINKHVCLDPMIYRRLIEDSGERFIPFHGYVKRTLGHYATLPKPVRDGIIRNTRRSGIERNLQSQG